MPSDAIMRVFDMPMGKLARMVTKGRADVMISQISAIEDELLHAGVKASELMQHDQVTSFTSYIVAPKNIDPRLLKRLLSATR